MVLEPGFAPGPDATDTYAVAARREIMNQYMMGECILVAPMFAGEKQRSVLLPAGKWYDFYSGAYAGEAETITITPGLEKIPMFVKDGGMVPMIPAQRQISRLPTGIPLEVRHYGTAEGTTSIYDDDGSSFAYENGQCTWMQIRATRQADGTSEGDNGRCARDDPVVIRNDFMEVDDIGHSEEPERGQKIGQNRYCARRRSFCGMEQTNSTAFFVDQEDR